MSRALPSDEIHVWTFSVTDARPAHLGLLSDDERERAGRFRHARAYSHFVLGRATLRQILSDYLDRDPAGIFFDYGAHGKPSLSDEAETGLHFNLSHSHELAVLAMTRGRAVGVDVEQINPERATDEIARRFFSAFEWGALQQLPAKQRTAAFFRCWTSKEAFIKLIGDGLTFPLDAFDVSPLLGEPPAILSVNGDANEARRWSLRELAVPPGYAATLVVEGQILAVVERQWNESAS